MCLQKQTYTIDMHIHMSSLNKNVFREKTEISSQPFLRYKCLILKFLIITPKESPFLKTLADFSSFSKALSSSPPNTIPTLPEYMT